MIKRRAFLLIGLLIWLGPAIAREGLWLPLLLEKYNLEEMQQMGFRLSASDIYDVNNASMKDAVVLFGGGCTGELVSPEGLLITNHHCGYRSIQSHSSVENDYLTHGFWAMSPEQELPNPGLTVSFLERMEDVTEMVLAGTEELTDQAQIDQVMHKNSLAIEQEASEKGRFRALVRPIFYGNQYFLHVYKVFTDVRLVGAPPSAIGKFGGDTDNWMWPRHTGDFAWFRIYAGPDNEPAPYSKDNVPYKPKKFFPISLKGVGPDDFTMVFGYPGRTFQYLTSTAVDLVLNQRNPDRIKVRDSKLEILSAYMENDPKTRIQYAAKHASTSNSWKKWQGENLGLNRLNAVARKKEFEQSFEQWAIAEGSWDNKYHHIFNQLEHHYAVYAPLIKANDFYSEIVWNGIDIFTLASYLHVFSRQVEREKQVSASTRASIIELVNRFFRDYSPQVDEQLFNTLLPQLIQGAGNQFLPTEILALRNQKQNYLIEKIYRKSIIADQAKLLRMLENFTPAQVRVLDKDPVLAIYSSLRNFFDTQIAPPLQKTETAIDALMKEYMHGIMQMESGKPLYPDANSTLRVAYGKVEGYEPRDGVFYKHFTTLEGIMEKDNPEVYDYDVPQKLREIFNTKTYGEYGKNGVMPVCFVASNHTTGGNSGSPVLNADGHLVGVNFDRCWEGTMSDIMFDPEKCRNIAIDIRYALFITDVFAGAGYLLGEMEIIR